MDIKAKLSQIIHNPLLFIALICLIFWIADTYLKVFILNAPSRMLWYSSAGLFVTTIGLLTRNSFLLTAMFCALVVNETLWSISFISSILFNSDVIGMTRYMFNSTLPTHQFAISLYHLILVPASIIGLISIRTVSRYGWIGAFLFVTIINVIAYYFPDSTENINCIQGPTLFSCKFFFNNVYSLRETYFNGLDKIWTVLLVSAILTFFVYLPVNLILILSAKLVKSVRND